MYSLPLSPVSPVASSKMNIRKQSWQQVGSHERAMLYSKIPVGLRFSEAHLSMVSVQQQVINVPRQCGLLSEAEIDITESDAISLINKLASGQLSSVAVTTAFCKRAAVAHQLVNLSR